MKTFKQIIAEVEEPKSPDEKRFKAKHVIQKTADVAGNGDDVYNATNIAKDKSKTAGHHPPEDREVYEEVNLEEKKLTPAELKKREEIAKSIERDNPDMPMDKKMAIATSTAKRVAENVSAPQTAAHRRAMSGPRYSDLQKNKVKLKGFGPDAAKGNMGNPSARAALKVKTEGTDNPPFDPDPKKKSAKNSDGTVSSPMSRAKQLAKQAMAKRTQKEEVEVQEADNFDKNFTKRIGATVRGGKGAEYLKKKAKEAQAQNKKLDPGAAKKGLGIGVTDSQKAYQKAKKKGVQFPRAGVRTSPRTRDASRLPEGFDLDEATAWANAGRALNDYARKDGGVDKADFEKAAKFLYQIEKAGLMQKSGHLANFSKFVKDLDTDVREKVFSILKQNKLMESIEEAGSPERLAMIKKAAQKVDREKKRAQRDAMKAIKKDPDLKSEELEEAVVDALQDIVKSKGAKQVKFNDGRTTKVDAYTASAMMNVYKNLNSTNQKKFADAINKNETMFMKMMDFAMSRVK